LLSRPLGGNLAKKEGGRRAVGAVEQIRKLAAQKHFSVRLLEIEGEQVTVVGAAHALDALIEQLAEVAEVNRDQLELLSASGFTPT
jgi:hypothetical protein